MRVRDGIELLLTDASGRKAFMAVHWKGKPSGLTLLCQLLSDGNLLYMTDYRVIYPGVARHWMQWARIEPR